jgi:hypothetical protein
MMIKNWQAEGIGLWKNTTASLFQSYEGFSYSIGPTGDHCSPDAYKTEIATVALSGASSIVVDSDDNISDGDYIGVELDDDTVQWTTVNGSPSSDTVTLTASLTDDTSVDNHVYNYTNKLQRPKEIVEARRVDPDGFEIPLTIISRDEYTRLSNKDSLGTVSQIYYDPQLTNGKMYVWPACSDVKHYIKFTARIPIEDFDSAYNDPDFPQEWFLPLSWNLAVLVSPKFGRGVDQAFLIRAEKLKLEARGFDMEDTSAFIRIGSKWR